MEKEKWVYIGNFGDVSFDRYNGFFVLYNKTYKTYRAIVTQNLYDAGVSENEEKTSLEWIEFSESELKDIDPMDEIPDYLSEHEKNAFKIQDVYGYYGFYTFTGEKPETYNITGLVRSLAEILSKIWEEAKAQGRGTDYVNQHPITRLFAEQIYYLAEPRDYYEAIEYCKRKVQAGKE